MRLSDMEIGQTKKVIKINNKESVKIRLKEIGLTEGAKITLIRKSPFLDPIEIKVRDFYLALRVSDAKMIEVE